MIAIWMGDHLDSRVMLVFPGSSPKDGCSTFLLYHNYIMYLMEKREGRRTRRDERGGFINSVSYLRGMTASLFSISLGCFIITCALPIARLDNNTRVYLIPQVTYFNRFF
jgi:hypothetical protein